MFKNKIVLKLSSYFAIALLVFSLIMGSVFMLLFRNHTISIHKDELTTRSTSIASTLSTFMESKNSKNGYGSYMKFIGDIATTDIWIVDENLNLITGGRGNSMVDYKYNYSDLPENADKLIKKVFTDEIAFSEDFSKVLSEMTLTIGTPIKDSNNNVIGVVLLHTPVNGVNEAITQGFKVLLISILVALILAFLLSIWFSFTFTKPLNKINNNALEIAKGNYSVKNNIIQNDEIGQLANTMDILTNHLDVANKQSEKLEQMRKDFVANISHELRTPVTVMRGSLEAIVDKIITDPIQIDNYNKQMLNESIFLQRLIGDLLDLSKLQSTDFIINKEKISIYDVISDVTRSAALISSNKEIKITVDTDNEPCIIDGDYGRIRQMIMIVLDNAIKFSPTNSTVKVVLKNKVLSIQDSGLGIPNDDLPYIFDRFYKSRSEQNKTGTGLGLAIAKQIANRHSIHLTAESSYSQGALFIFKL